MGAERRADLVDLGGDLFGLDGVLGVPARDAFSFSAAEVQACSRSRERVSRSRSSEQLVTGVLAAQQQSLGEGVDEALAVARDRYGDSGGLGDGAVPADQDVEDDAVDAVVLAVERDGTHDVAALEVPVDAALALLVASGVPAEVVVDDRGEALLQVDALREAVGGDEDVVAVGGGQFSHPAFALGWREFSGDADDRRLLLQRAARCSAT